MDVDGRALPRLAREWAWENGGLRLRLTLREGVRVHDGTLLTASAVAETLRAAIANEGNQIVYSSFANVTSVRAIGELDLAIDLSRPSAFLPEDLELRIGIGPNNLGTGAFRIVNASPQEITLERFDDYHLGPARINRVVIRTSPTLRTAWTSLLRGDVDMVTNVPPDAIEFVSNDDVQLISFARPYQFMIAFNSQRGPLSSPLVRRALNLAVNREALIERVLQSRGMASTGAIWPQHWAYDRSIPGFAFDPGQAGALLDAAGFPLRNQLGLTERFNFTCLIPENFTLVERVALEVQKQLYDIGVNIRFEVVPGGEFDLRGRSGRFEALLIDMVSGLGMSRSQMFWRSAKTVKGMNVFGYENVEAERLFRLLSETTNEAAVRSATSRVQRVLLDDPPALFLAWTQGFRSVRRDFQVVEEPGIDPLYTIWRWTPAPSATPSRTD